GDSLRVTVNVPMARSDNTFVDHDGSVGIARHGARWYRHPIAKGSQQITLIRTLFTRGPGPLSRVRKEPTPCGWPQLGMRVGDSCQRIGRCGCGWTGSPSAP